MADLPGVRGSERAALYRSLARLLDVGVTGPAFFSALRAGGQGREVRRVIGALETAQSECQPLWFGLSRAAPVIPHHDALAVKAAERSGNVPEALAELAAAEEEREASRRGAALQGWYAVGLLQLAVIAPNSGLLYTEPASGVAQVLGTLLPLNALLYLAWRALRRPPRSYLASLLLLFIPGLSRVIRLGDYRLWLLSLERLHRAGVPLVESIREALDAVRNAAFRRKLRIATLPVSYGKPLSDTLDRLPGLPKEVGAMLASAEPAGELDGALAHSAALCAELEDAARGRALRIAAAFGYAAAAAYVAVRLVLFYLEHFAYLELG